MCLNEVKNILIPVEVNILILIEINMPLSKCSKLYIPFVFFNLISSTKIIQY